MALGVDRAQGRRARGVHAVVGTRVIPWVLDRVAATRSRELFTLTVLVLALGIAVGSARVFGVSMALGAFLAGMVVGRSEYSLRAASDALPMRDAFAVLFFVSVGMLLDPRILLAGARLLVATLAIVIVGKPLVALVVVLLIRYPFSAALDGRGRARANRRVLVHPRRAQQGSGRPPPSGDEYHGRGVDRLDRREPAALPGAALRATLADDPSDARAPAKRGSAGRCR